ncbi:hypothetical protein GCM10023238_21290 [Streptomyces heliomycini]
MAAAAGGRVVGGQFHQAVGLVAEVREQRDPGETGGQRGGEVQQPVVTGAGVPPLVGEDGVELVVGEPLQGRRW